ncbi:MAG: YceI family protein [Sphingobacteriales bacterium]|nr:YceI family protein [Sphingobacteriales bacterium]
MKKIILSLAILFAGVSASQAQEIQNSKAINVHFFSSASLEDIEATTQNGISMITTAKNEFFFLVPIKSFTFKSSLMQEHFNENYMESDKFTDARFSGKVNEDIDWKKDGVNNVTVTGKLTIHGVDKDRTIPGVITVKNGVISISSKFDVTCKEHGIKIPTMLAEKVAEVVSINVSGIYAPYVKK